MNDTNATLRNYLVLMRLDKPVGSLLLLWPTLATLWMAAEGFPGLLLVVVFTVGTVLMRSAGCVINDYADRRIDAHVHRTAERPLATGRVTPKQALGLFAALVACAALLLPLLNWPARWLAVAGLIIAMIYPFMKRWTHMPQVVLGAAFSWGMPMGWAAVTGSLDPVVGLMFVGSLVWIVAYDTLYAMVDREDDLRIGVKSTAILFGSLDRLIVGLLQIMALAAFALAGQRLGYGVYYLGGLAAMAGCFAYQQFLIRKREGPGCFAAFKNNVWAGFCLFAGTVAQTQAPAL